MLVLLAFSADGAACCVKHCTGGLTIFAMLDNWRRRNGHEDGAEGYSGYTVKVGGSSPSPPTT